MSTRQGPPTAARQRGATTASPRRSRLRHVTLLVVAVTLAVGGALGSATPPGPAPADHGAVEVAGDSPADQAAAVLRAVRSAGTTGVPAAHRGAEPAADGEYRVQPPTDSRTRAHLVPEGLTVRPGPAGTDFVTRPTGTGVQAFTVLHGPDASPVSAYRVPGASLALEPNGGVRILVAGEQVGAIAPPWAVDAAGRELATHYTVDGETLRQHVDTRSAAFPVVADPDISFGWFAYLKFSREEVRRFAPLLAAESAVAPSLICRQVPPGKAHKFCTKAVGKYARKVAATWRKAAEQGMCVEHKYVYVTAYLVGWKAYDCGGRPSSGGVSW